MKTNLLLFLFVVISLILINIIVPLVTAEFSGSATSNTFDVEQNFTRVADSVTESGGSATGAITAIKAILGVFLWSFGNLPVWLDLFLTIFRTVGYLIVILWIRGVGT